ncbi:50S ribosomal protein L4, partial [bacterium]|nr:50S ribosomal protein L4 [bacterium]
PATTEMAAVLKALDLGSSKTLMLVPRSDVNVTRSGKNLPKFDVQTADKASTYDLVNNQVLLIQKSAVEVLQNTFKN